MIRINTIAAAGLAICLLFGTTRSDAADSESGSEGQDPAPPAEQILFVGTGPVVGVYFPAGGAVCSMVNRERALHGIRCTVESTEGSIDNLAALRSGDLDMAVTQSDWQYYAYEGKALFEEDGAFEELRSILTLHGEPITVVAHPDADIETLPDLVGKRINIGVPGSGQHVMAETLIETLGWTSEDFAALLEIEVNEQSRGLCAGAFDAFILPVGHPNGAIQEAVRGCGAVLIDLSGAEIDQLIEDTPYFAKTVIPAGTYPGNPDAIAAFGVKATLVATTRLSEEMVYQVVKAVFENFDHFKAMHPAFAGLTPEEMIGAGNSAPLHPGALRYYKERGWR